MFKPLTKTTEQTRDEMGTHRRYQYKRVGWKRGLSGKGQAILPSADKSAVQRPAFVTGVYKPVRPWRKSQNKATHHIDRLKAVCRRGAQLCFGSARTALMGGVQTNEKGGISLLFHLSTFGMFLPVDWPCEFGLYPKRYRILPISKFQ